MGLLSFMVGLGKSIIGNIFLGSNETEAGDSYMAGQGASPASNSYNQKFRAFLQSDTTGRVFSQGGSGVYKMVSSFQASVNEFTSGIIYIQCGFNDVRRQVTLAKTLEKIRGAYRVTFINSFAKTYHQASTFTQVGTWAGIGAGLFGNKFTALNNVGAGTLSKTISGKNFGIVLLGTSNNTFGNLIITVDGVEVFNGSMSNRSDGVSDGTYDNVIVPWGLFVLGLSAGPHNFVLTSTDSTPVDFIAELVDYPTDYSNTVLVVGMPLMPAAGYLVAPANADESMIISANAVIAAEINAIKAKFPISLVDITGLDKLTDFDPDNVHINNSGHQKVFDLTKAKIAINQSFLLFSSLKDIVYWNGYYQSKNAATWGSYGLSGLYLPAGADGFVQFNIENLTDANFGMVGFNATKALEDYPNYEYGASFYDADLRKLTAGGGFLVVQAGPLSIGGKVQLGRYAGVIKMRYAADGSTFVDVQNWGASATAYYLNINMVENKKAYGLITSGFVVAP